ncbi:MAG: sulfotransferase domain-containing protein [Candidatus Hodarchaeota archaeon]
MNVVDKIYFYGSLLINSWSDSFIQIIEHQKSGGSWLARILSDYFDCTFYSSQSIGWMKKKGIVRIHPRYQYTGKSSNQIYVLRDGRDVLTSYYFHMFYRLEISQSKYFEDINNIKANMSKYLEMYYRNKLNNKIIWDSHVIYWTKIVKHIVRYEDLLVDTFGTVKRLIEEMQEKSVDERKLKSAIEKNDFKKLSGRTKGEEDSKSFFRKGISGDWKNYFNNKSARIFNKFSGATLIKFGYEDDDSWVSRC